MTDARFAVRPASEDDRLPLAKLFAVVAEERDGIAAEPPIDVERRASTFVVENTFVATSEDEVIGGLFVIGPSMGSGEIAMFVARDWRGCGVGSGLVSAAIEWARADARFHKLSLSVFPHNAAAIALYRKYDFEVEGRRVKQVRRASGELWDLVDMGLLLTN